jgi:hypothetical protein
MIGPAHVTSRAESRLTQPVLLVRLLTRVFDLPCPPDVVTWAKKAQNGVLFVSEELATFFQEEKKRWRATTAGS